VIVGGPGPGCRVLIAGMAVPDSLR